jgi:hypothetical protein
MKISPEQLKTIINEEIASVKKESATNDTTVKVTLGELKSMLKEAMSMRHEYLVYLKGVEEPIRVKLSDDQIADIASDDPTEVPGAVELVLKKAYPDMEDFELA